MKKLIIGALCIFLMAQAGFALEKAAGGGLLYNFSFTSGEADIIGEKWTMSRNGFGAFGFFGISQFAEFNLGLLYKNPNKIKVGSQSVSASDWDINSTAALQLGAYGKYPFTLSDKLVVFPTAGVDFEITLADYWWHDLWFRAGGGVDFFLTETMFLRGHLIYGVAVPIGGESDFGTKVTHGGLIKVGIGWMF